MRASSRYERCAHAETRKPGASSRVTAAPPTRSAASTTIVSRPALARYAAHTRPLWPAPITIARFRSVILPALGHEIGPAQIEQNFARCIGARGRHYAAARVRAGAAHIKAADRPAILRVTGERPVEQQLIQRELALENVALGEPHFVLELTRRAHLDVPDEILEVRAVARSEEHTSELQSRLHLV